MSHMPCQDHLGNAMDEMLGSLSPPQVIKLQRGLGKIIESSHGEIPFGTLFGGCELIRHVLDVCSDKYHARFGRRLNFKHKFTVEIDEWKQKFTDAHFGPLYQFGDIFELRKKKWKGTEINSGKVMAMPKIQMLFAGSECDTFCSFNTRAPELNKAEIISQGLGKSGTTGKALLDYIVDNRVPLSILENAKLMGEKNVVAMIMVLNDKGFFVHPFIPNALHYKSGAARERQCMVVIAGDTDCKIDQLKLGSTSYVPPTWMSEFDDAMFAQRVGPSRAEQFLLPDNHPKYTSWHAEAVADRRDKDVKEKAMAMKAGLKRSADGEVKEAKVEEWQADHLELFRAASLDWPPNLDADAIVSASTAHLVRRHRESVVYNLEIKKPDDPVDTYHDMNVTLKWKSRSSNHVQTIVCTSRIYCALHNKELWGGELLNLQGFPLIKLIPGCATHTQLIHLAGNSFNAYMFMPIMTALFISIADAWLPHLHSEGLVLSDEEDHASMQSHGYEESMEEECDPDAASVSEAGVISDSDSD
jgi:site-specific DNA-cytosine methylase